MEVAQARGGGGGHDGGGVASATQRAASTEMHRMSGSDIEWDHRRRSSRQDAAASLGSWHMGSWRSIPQSQTLDRPAMQSERRRDMNSLIFSSLCLTLPTRQPPTNSSILRLIPAI